MPDEDKGIHRIIPEKGDSPAKRRQKVIVLGTIILVVLTFLILRNRSSSSASSATDPNSGDVTSDPSGFTPAASSDGSGDYNAQLAGEIGSIPNQVSSQLNNQTLNRLVNARANLKIARERNTQERKRLAAEKSKLQAKNRRIAVLQKQVHAKNHPKPVHHSGKKAG